MVIRQRLLEQSTKHVRATPIYRPLDSPDTVIIQGEETAPPKREVPAQMARPGGQIPPRYKRVDGVLIEVKPGEYERMDGILVAVNEDEMVSLQPQTERDYRLQFYPNETTINSDIDKRSRELLSTDPARIVELARQEVETAKMIREKGLADARKNISEKPPVTSKEGTAEYVQQMIALNDWEHDNRFYRSLIPLSDAEKKQFPRWKREVDEPTYYEGLQSDEVFKRPEIRTYQHASTDPSHVTVTERQKQIIEFVKELDLGKTWLKQAERIDLLAEAALERILETHIVRGMVLSNRENMERYKTDKVFRISLWAEARKLNPHDLVGKAGDDLVSSGVLHDGLVSPQKHGGVTARNTFTVVGERTTPLEYTDVAKDSDQAMGQKGIYGVLIAQEIKPVPDRPELEGMEFKYLELNQLVTAVKQRFIEAERLERAERTEQAERTEMDDRVALMAVGRYLAQKRIRMFGFNPSIVRLVITKADIEGKAPENILGQRETEDDFISLIRHNADRVETTLKDHPFPVDMTHILSICFPHKPGMSFQPYLDKIRETLPDEKQQTFIEQLAYIGLGYALEDKRVTVRGQGDTIIVGRPGELK